jgi:hypothetical protein
MLGLFFDQDGELSDATIPDLVVGQVYRVAHLPRMTVK